MLFIRASTFGNTHNLKPQVTCPHFTAFPKSAKSASSASTLSRLTIHGESKTMKKSCASPDSRHTYSTYCAGARKHSSTRPHSLRDNPPRAGTFYPCVSGTSGSASRSRKSAPWCEIQMQTMYRTLVAAATAAAVTLHVCMCFTKS